MAEKLVGRPISQPLGGGKVVLGVRVSPTLKRKIISALQVSHRSLSAEAEFRLERSFDNDELVERVLLAARAIRGDHDRRGVAMNSEMVARLERSLLSKRLIDDDDDDITEEDVASGFLSFADGLEAGYRFQFQELLAEGQVEGEVVSPYEGDAFPEWRKIHPRDRSSPKWTGSDLSFCDKVKAANRG
jgi:hypothetical protein